MKKPVSESHNLDKLGDLVIQSELFAQGLEDHMFGILPKDSLSDLMEKAKYGLNPQMTAHIQETIEKLGKEGSEDMDE